MRTQASVERAPTVGVDLTSSLELEDARTT